jgi:hypothetical protein
VWGLFREWIQREDGAALNPHGADSFMYQVFISFNTAGLSAPSTSGCRNVRQGLIVRNFMAGQERQACRSGSCNGLVEGFIRNPPN